MTTFVLRDATDWPGLRRAVRHAIGAGLAPDDVHWRCGGRDTPSLFADERDGIRVDALDEGPPLSLPAGFVETARTVIRHDDAGRFDAILRMAVRLHADRRIWSDPLDAPRLALTRMAAAVRHEQHRMKAFVRFRRVPDDEVSGGERWVAWFEPAHHVVAAVAPFFRDRFTTMHWAVLTPRGCIAWDGRTLLHGPPATAAQAPAPDDGEHLWLAYYRSIFNPARVNLAALKAELPVRFWRNLPEATQIAPLVAAAVGRTGAMVEAPPSVRERVRGTGCATVPRRASPASAHDPTTLDALARRAAGCDRCSFAAMATGTVWGEGRAGAALMLVGEQPGDHEDLEGRPFVGPAGRLLRETLAALGWPADRVYLTNAVKHFRYEPRGKRRIHKTAAQRDVQACSEWLEAEIAAVGPRALVALGATAAGSLLGAAVPVGDVEGRWLHRADGLPVLVVRHPAALLRLPDAARPAALLRWRAALAQAGPVITGAPHDVPVLESAPSCTTRSAPCP